MKCIRIIRIEDREEFLEKTLKPMGFTSYQELKESGYSFEDLEGYYVLDFSTEDIVEVSEGEFESGSLVMLVGGRWYPDSITVIKYDDKSYMPKWEYDRLTGE